MKDISLLIHLAPMPHTAINDLLKSFEKIFLEHHPKAYVGSFESLTYKDIRKRWTVGALRDFLFAVAVDETLALPEVECVTLTRVNKGGGRYAVEIGITHTAGNPSSFFMVSSRAYDHHDFSSRASTASFAHHAKTLNDLRFFAGNTYDFFKLVPEVTLDKTSLSPEQTVFSLLYARYPFHRPLVERFVLTQRINEKNLNKTFEDSPRLKM